MHQWQLLLLLLCVHAGTERCGIAARQELQLENALGFLKKEEIMLIHGKAESKWGVISDCKMSASSKYLKESKTEEEGKSRIIFPRKLWGLE